MLFSSPHELRVRVGVLDSRLVGYPINDLSKLCAWRSPNHGMGLCSMLLLVLNSSGQVALTRLSSP